MSFDAEALMHATVDEQFDSKYTSIPEGDYEAYIKDVKIRTVKDSVLAEVLWVILDEGVKALLNRDEPVVRQSVWLDVDETGRLATGKNRNIKLGQLRQAVGQENPPWELSQLVGAGPAVVHVTHRANPNDPENPYVEVNRVVRMS